MPYELGDTHELPLRTFLLASTWYYEFLPPADPQSSPSLFRKYVIIPHELRDIH